MEKIVIHTVSPVWTWCNKAAADTLRNLLSYEYVIWESGRFGKTKSIRKRYLIEGHTNGNYFFLSGFVPKCLSWLNKNFIEYEYNTDIQDIQYNSPHLPGISLRPYQEKLCRKAVETGFGVVKSPTGSGKSIMMYGLVSCFQKENVLILVHSLDLVQQLYIGLVETGFKDCGVYTSKKPQMHRITVCTVQTYVNICKDWKTHWDVVIVDEGHHVSSTFKGNYFGSLTRILAPCRYAFTATLSDNQEGRHALEGLIGPVIGELTMVEGQELGFLSTPEIIFRGVEIPTETLMLRKDVPYTTLYKDGIVGNWNRNSKIAWEAEQEVKNNGTVLILVRRISHIQEITSFLNMEVDVVQGVVPKEERLRIKEDLKSGKIKCVIATTAWTEGIDLPNLTMVINAAGGKSERETLQKIGRGLRKTENKNTVKIIEFMDIGYFGKDVMKVGSNSNILHRQSIARWKVYKEQGWSPILDKRDSHLFEKK